MNLLGQTRISVTTENLSDPIRTDSLSANDGSNRLIHIRLETARVNSKLHRVVGATQHRRGSAFSEKVCGS